ncbi:MAG TPA: tRNA pseudouridine(38-40) synthase TruA [Sulfurimonas sp.]|nr:tRNA pseudouridine(38-40) synthase TruA [Sulfurimonas sp.]
MYYYHLIVSYKGTNYFGWQDLGEKDQRPSIQASIHQILKKICKYQECTISSASRTDAGVHAQGQVVKISIPLSIDSEKLLLGMNSLLPDDIRILQCKSCAPEFNPNKDCKSKEYHYYFCADTVYNPVFNDIVTHIPTNTKNSTTGPLDIQRMQQACKLFIGEHDFYNFAKRDTNISSSFRTIFSCEIVEVPSSSFGNKIYYLKVVGKGFLRYMVRYMAGALFALGKKQLSLNDIEEALLHHKDEKISSRAKSKGLHLIQVSYYT